MYIPDIFTETDRDVAFSLIEEIRIGTTVSAVSRIEASLVPFLLDRHVGTNGQLIGHCARANHQWKDFESAPDVLVSFLSSNTHVSPSWYRTRPRAPTWLYANIHVRGKVRLIKDEATTRAIVVRLSDEMEPPGSSWKVDDVGAYVDRILPGLHRRYTKHRDAAQAGPAECDGRPPLSARCAGGRQTQSAGSR